MILTDAFIGPNSTKGDGRNEPQDRAAIHTPLRDMERESGTLETWGARHGASLTPVVGWRSQGLGGVAVGSG